MQRTIVHLVILLAIANSVCAQHDVPAPLREVGVEEKLGAELPLDAVFTDEIGKRIKLRDALRPGKPNVLQLSYFRCPMLCDTVSRGLLQAMKDLDLKMGEDFGVINVSFDPKDRPADAYLKKKSFVQQYDRPGGTSWQFLVGDQASIHRLSETVGFKYKYDPATDQFAHAAVLMVISPDGKVMRYLYGVEYPGKTLRLSLVEASEGRIGTTLDRVLMLCFRYSPAEGRYTLFAVGLMRIAGALTVVTLGLVLGGLFLKERRARRAAE